VKEEVWPRSWIKRGEGKKRKWLPIVSKGGERGWLEEKENRKHKSGKKKRGKRERNLPSLVGEGSRVLKKSTPWGGGEGTYHHIYNIQWKDKEASQPYEGEKKRAPFNFLEKQALFSSSRHEGPSNF